jgi:hypothetical protein
LGAQRDEGGVVSLMLDRTAHGAQHRVHRELPRGRRVLTLEAEVRKTVKRRELQCGAGLLFPHFFLQHLFLTQIGRDVPKVFVLLLFWNLTREIE